MCTVLRSGNLVEVIGRILETGYVSVVFCSCLQCRSRLNPSEKNSATVRVLYTSRPSDCIAGGFIVRSHHKECEAILRIFNLPDAGPAKLQSVS